ncbi:MAG: outer membrane beta-barrel protein [Chlorobiaceae bacterium]
MKKYHLLLGVFFTAGTPGLSAFAIEPSFISANIGVLSKSDTTLYNPVALIQQESISSVSGIHLTNLFGSGFNHVRFEVETGYQRNDADKIIIDSGIFTFRGDRSVTSYMANGYYNFKAGAVHPFLIAGLGLAQVSIHHAVNPPNTISETYSGLGYQIGSGIAITVTQNISLDLQYRYFGTYPVTLNNYNGYFKVPGNSVLLWVMVGF